MTIANNTKDFAAQLASFMDDDDEIGHEPTSENEYNAQPEALFADQLDGLIDNEPRFEKVTIGTNSFMKPVRSKAEEKRLQRLQAAGLIKAPGRKLPTSKTKIRLSNKDIEIIGFLSVAKIITPKQAMMIAKDSTMEQAAYKRLKRLTEAKYLQQWQAWGRAKSFFTLGRKGYQLLEERGLDLCATKVPMKEFDVLNAHLKHSLAMSQWLAMMVAFEMPRMSTNVQNSFILPTELEKLALFEDPSMAYKYCHIIHEDFIKSKISYLLGMQQQKGFFGGNRRQAHYELIYRHNRASIFGGYESTPGIFFTPGKSVTEGVYEPDFIIQQEKLGSGKNIAVEIELSAKTPKVYDKKLAAYESSAHYRQVYYYTVSDSVKAAIERSVARIGAQKVIVRPLLSAERTPILVRDINELSLIL